MSYLVSKDKKECFGCGCCREICPIKCIVMMKDKEGFSYPQINMEQCINCRKCITVCPYQNNLKLIDKDFQQEVFAAVNRDEKILYESSSGGAFDAIIKSYCQRDDIVLGYHMILICRSCIKRHEQTWQVKNLESQNMYKVK